MRRERSIHAWAEKASCLTYACMVQRIADNGACMIGRGRDSDNYFRLTASDADASQFLPAGVVAGCDEPIWRAINSSNAASMGLVA